MNVKVFTDSTAGLPTELVTEHDIGVVDVQLRLGDRVDDERRFARAEIIEAMNSGHRVETSPPDPGAFFWAYQRAVGSGADAIVSLHISGKMSATAEAARQACQHIRVPVYVIDTETTGMSLGYAVLIAARTAAASGDPGQVVGAARQRYETSTELIYVDTLGFLRAGGRIGGASALLGTALSVKPLLTLQHGEVTPLTRVTGARRALSKLTDLALERAGSRPVDVTVAALTPGEQEKGLQRSLEQRLLAPGRVMLAPASTVIGAHVGPGAVGITVSPESTPETTNRS